MNSLPAPELIAEKGAILVINKPGGLLTQGPPGIDSMELRIKQYLKVRDEKPGKVYLGVPHRLDRPASGVMLFAKNVRAAKRLADQFQQRIVKKKYWAIVEGHPEPEGIWTDFMRKLTDEAKSEICREDDSDSRQAILRYKVMAQTSELSWLEIELETGRTHQIRLQCSHRGHPIVGDQLYKSRIEFGPQSFDQRKRWIGLHAREIEFEHPIDKQWEVHAAHIPNHWRELEFKFPDD